MLMTDRVGAGKIVLAVGQHVLRPETGQGIEDAVSGDGAGRSQIEEKNNMNWHNIMALM